MKKERVIVWFRNDLRLDDNEALYDALKSGEEVVPIYVFDNRIFSGRTKYGFAKTGKYRFQFIIESVKNLRQNLQKLNSDLIVRIGKPEDVIFEIASEIKSSWVFCNRERTQEEVDVQDALEKQLWSIGQEVRYSRGKMLYYTADLPFPVTHMPDQFTTFRKEVEKLVHVRDPLPAPREAFKSLGVEIDPGEMPSLSSFGVEDKVELVYPGGEDKGLDRIHHYIWESNHIKEYKETRNELLGKDFSSKFSPYLAQGCISPKRIYYELKKYEAERCKNDSTYWMFFEILWRDFFRLIGKKYGNAIFQPGGIKQQVNPDLTDNFDLFNLWKAGKTGIPFVDANMIELNETGFMSNRGRQNVASFLINDLKVNWRIGAEYFESLLIDYDPCSNYGNWNYIAGVGTDTRPNRYFNVILQAKKYDADGRYVKHWIPSLRKLEAPFYHQPYLMETSDQVSKGFILERDFQKPIISLR